MKNRDIHNSAKLEILICTIGHRGLENVAAMKLPEIPQVCYTVSCQNPERENIDELIAKLCERKDVRVRVFFDRGLSINRNHALDIATAPYLLIADDDLEYFPEGLKKIISVFDADPKIDIATFRVATPEMKIYPSEKHSLRKPCKNYYVSSVEIALRRACVSKNGLMFSPLAGIGAPYLSSGEENIFIHKALAKGLNGYFIPVDIAIHNGPTTSCTTSASAGFLRSKGACLRIIRGYVGGGIRLFVEAGRANRAFVPAMFYLLEGYIYSIKHRKEL